MMKTLLAGLTMLILPLYATASVVSGEPAPDFEATDAHGKVHRLGDFLGKYVVLEWYNHGCPFVQKYYKSNAMQELQKRLTGEGAVWLSINSGAEGKQGHMSPDETIEKAASVGAASTALILDQDGTIGRLFGAKATPHMFLIDPAGIFLKPFFCSSHIDFDVGKALDGIPGNIIGISGHIETDGGYIFLLMGMHEGQEFGALSHADAQKPGGKGIE